MGKVLQIAGLLGLTMTGIIFLAIFQNLFLYDPDYWMTGAAKFFDIGFAVFAALSGLFCLWYAFRQINYPSGRLNLIAFALSATLVVIMGTLHDLMDKIDGVTTAPTISTIWLLSPIAIMSAAPIFRMVQGLSRNSQV